MLIILTPFSLCKIQSIRCVFPVLIKPLAYQMKASFGSRATRGFKRTRHLKILSENAEPKVLKSKKWY